MNDSCQPATQGVIFLFRQQFRRVTDRRRRIADLVRHICRQTAQRGRFELLRMEMHARHVFDIKQRITMHFGRRPVAHAQMSARRGMLHLDRFGAMSMP